MCCKENNINRYSIIAIVLLVASCAHNKGTPTIVADGTEKQQLENLYFCGNSAEFSKEMVLIGKQLNAAWKNVVGDKPTSECSIYIETDIIGNITKYEVESCQDKVSLEKAIEEASPINLPKNTCIANKISSIGFVLNNEK